MEIVRVLMMATQLDRKPRKKSRIRSIGDTLGILDISDSEESDEVDFENTKVMKAIA